MILILLFIALFLTGIALFTAGISSTFLNRPVARRRTVYEPRLKERNYRKEFRNSYLDRINQRAEKKKEKVDTEKHLKAKEAKAAPREKRAVRFKPQWVFILMGMIGVMFLSAYFGYMGYQAIAAKPKIVFCEKIDFGRMKPINVSDMFTRGNVSVYVKSAKSFDLERAQIDIYKVDNNSSERYANKKIPLKPEWTAFSVRVLFERIGSYNVRISDTEGRLITQKSIHIVPDHFAYKAVQEM